MTEDFYLCGNVKVMEDVLDGVIVPHWCSGSVLMFALLVALIVLASLTLVEAVRWFIERCKRGFSREDIWKTVLFAVLFVTSCYRGYFYFEPLLRWAYCVLRISSTPSLEVLQDGMIIQEYISEEIVRGVSRIVLYFSAFLLIRKDRKH